MKILKKIYIIWILKKNNVYSNNLDYDFYDNISINCLFNKRLDTHQKYFYNDDRINKKLLLWKSKLMEKLFEFKNIQSIFV